MYFLEKTDLDNYFKFEFTDLIFEQLRLAIDWKRDLKAKPKKSSQDILEEKVATQWIEYYDNLSYIASDAKRMLTKGVVQNNLITEVGALKSPGPLTSPMNPRNSYPNTWRANLDETIRIEIESNEDIAERTNDGGGAGKMYVARSYADPILPVNPTSVDPKLNTVRKIVFKEIYKILVPGRNLARTLAKSANFPAHSSPGDIVISDHNEFYKRMFLAWLDYFNLLISENIRILQLDKSEVRREFSEEISHVKIVNRAINEYLKPINTGKTFALHQNDIIVTDKIGILELRDFLN